MKITKFKKISKGKYKVLLDNNESLTLYEDVIINNNLLLSKEVNNDLLDELINQNNDVHAYGMALNYISIRMRSIMELKEYLLNKKISKTIVEKTINRLTNEGYLDDFKFAKAFLNDKITISSSGPLKIRKELLKYGINNTIINEVISEVDNNVVKEKLSNLMKKQIKIKKDSANSLKLKLINYFTNLGYEKQMVLDELANYDLKSDTNKLNKDYYKLYNKYKGKYSGSKLEYFLAQKLYSKGYTSDDITKVIKENHDE